VDFPTQLLDLLAQFADRVVIVVIILIILIAILVVLFVFLGNTEFDRAAQRRAELRREVARGKVLQLDPNDLRRLRRSVTRRAGDNHGRGAAIRGARMASWPSTTMAGRTMAVSGVC
jgi:hypothetical protein